jgi:hypothetical protein
MKVYLGPGDIIVGQNKLGVTCICLIESLTEEKEYNVHWTYSHSMKPFRDTVTHTYMIAIIKRPGWKLYKVVEPV